ncbi:hypothetical protein SAMN05216320_11510 [Duganella sp. OV458]|nr:hypothetical protein SAMN05216320_11510 [Duganella sp. OV458]SDK69627.1 hypothetical protein SAMN05428973_115118 [Duganella sp. OV510]
MPAKEMDGYEVEFTGELLEGSEQWGAYVSIFAPSDNPMHMNNVCPKRRVAADQTFTAQRAAEVEAERAATGILEELRA